MFLYLTRHGLLSLKLIVVYTWQKSLSHSPRTNRLSYRLTWHPHTHTQSKKLLNCYVLSSLSNVCNSFYSGYVHPFGSHYILVVGVFPGQLNFNYIIKVEFIKISNTYYKNNIKLHLQQKTIKKKNY